MQWKGLQLICLSSPHFDIFINTQNVTRHVHAFSYQISNDSFSQAHLRTKNTNTNCLSCTNFGTVLVGVMNLHYYGLACSVSLVEGLLSSSCRGCKKIDFPLIDLGYRGRPRLLRGVREVLNARIALSGLMYVRGRGSSPVSGAPVSPRKG